MESYTVELATLFWSLTAFDSADIKFAGSPKITKLLDSVKTSQELPYQTLQNSVTSATVADFKRSTGIILSPSIDCTRPSLCIQDINYGHFEIKESRFEAISSQPHRKNLVDHKLWYYVRNIREPEDGKVTSSQGYKSRTISLNTNRIIARHYQFK